MIRPLSSGDICIIVCGMNGTNSPNVGKLITIDKRVYGDHGLDHRMFGPVYACIGRDLTVLDNGGEYRTVSKCDIPGIWLKRIDGTSPAAQNSVVTSETAEA